MPSSENGSFANVYTDKAAYDAAMAEWQRKKAAGDPFPGPMPRMDVPGQIDQKIGQINFPTQIRNADFWQGLAKAGADAGPRANPYSTTVADQSRAAQLALIQQMRGQMAGPSLAAMQGQQAMGRSGQQALGAAAMGAPGRAAMLQSGQIGGGMAGNVAQARLAEVMRSQAGMGAAAGALRGNDLRSAEAGSQAGLTQRGQDDALRRFYASQGTALSDSQNRVGLELYKLKQRLALQARQNDLEKANAAAGSGATVAGGLV